MPRGKAGTAPPVQNWLCKCRTCNVHYAVPPLGKKSFDTDIRGKARCPEKDCQGPLVQTKRNPDIIPKVITREQAGLRNTPLR